MATYVTPIDSETDPDAPIKSELGKRWDHNVVAVCEGDVTAPPVGGTLERVEVIEITSTVTAITFTTDISTFRDIKVLFSGQMSDTATILLQARVAAGTWRTLGTFVKSGAGAGDTVLESMIHNVNRSDGTNKKVVSSVFADLEGDAVGYMLSDDNAETFTEVRLTATEFRNSGVAKLYGVHPLTRDASA